MYRISVMKNQEKKIDINELCALVDIKKRKLRYYIQKKIIDSPEGTGKGAFYTHKHLEQLLVLKKWKNEGLSLERIREIIQNTKNNSTKELLSQLLPAKKQGTVEVWSHLYIDEGLELHIEPHKANLSREKSRYLLQEITKLYQSIKNKES